MNEKKLRMNFDFLAFLAKSPSSPYPAKERHEVMFTERKHLYVFDNHNFLMVFIEDGVVQDICRSLDNIWRLIM